jgi:hypothetical protein
MKKSWLMLTSVLMYGLLSGSWVLAEEQATDSNSEWDVLLEEPEAVPVEPPPGGPGPGGRDRPGHRGAGPEMRPRRAGPEGPGAAERMEQRKPRRQADRPERGPGRRERPMRLQQVDPDELLKFLAEHEPTLAERLERLKIDEPEEYELKMPLLGRLYGPVMRQMMRNPAMAEISLRKIRLHLKIKSALAEAKEQADSDEAAPSRKALRKSVAELFDVILEQEELRVSEMKSRLDRWSDLAEKYGKDGWDDDKTMASGKQRGRGVGRARLSALRNRLTEQEGQLDRWRDNRKQIINLRVAELLAGEKRFPWGP